MATRYRLAQLRGDGEFLTVVAARKKLTIGIFKVATISRECLLFIRALVRQHEAKTGTPALEKLKVGSRLPPIEKLTKKGWRDFDEVQKRGTPNQKIFVEGKEARGCTLGVFNNKLASRSRQTPDHER
jgi:hypothetical protein